MQLFPHHLLDLLSVFFIAFAAWSFIGYKRKWTHIYCSYQNAYHKAMTPDAVNWNSIKKTDVYLVPLIFFLLGIVALLFARGYL